MAEEDTPPLEDGTAAEEATPDEDVPPPTDEERNDEPDAAVLVAAEEVPADVDVAALEDAEAEALDPDPMADEEPVAMQLWHAPNAPAASHTWKPIRFPPHAQACWDPWTQRAAPDDPLLSPPPVAAQPTPKNATHNQRQIFMGAPHWACWPAHLGGFRLRPRVEQRPRNRAAHSRFLAREPEGCRAATQTTAASRPNMQTMQVQPSSGDGAHTCVMARPLRSQ